MWKRNNSFTCDPEIIYNKQYRVIVLEKKSNFETFILPSRCYITNKPLLRLGEQKITSDYLGRDYTGTDSKKITDVWVAGINVTTNIFRKDMLCWLDIRKKNYKLYIA